jgi:lipoprotein-releasing system ATP-binding protein
LLRAESIQKTYPTRSGDLIVLQDVDLALEPGQSAVVMGPSGSGKSTLLNILGTLDPPTQGTVSIDGENPYTLNGDRLAGFRNRRIGFVFQEHHLLPQCNVLDNVVLPTLAHGGSDDAVARACDLLERVGLQDRRDHLPSELSGGERQRVALARALINRPRLVLADEPTGNLDRRTADRIGELLSQLHQDEKAVLVVVTHSEALADRFQFRYELEDGRLVPVG